MIGKLGNVAENIPKVYASGYETGYSMGNEAGKQAEYNDFWDTYQSNGNRKNYNAFFQRAGWKNGSTYKPKYPIECTANNYASNMFLYSGISDTLIPITITGSHLSVFNGSAVVTIPHLDISGVTANINDWFTGCTELASITIVGTIPVSINFKDCPLTAKSLVNIVEHLSDTASGKTLTVKSSAVSNADWSTTEYESWDALIATKSNWSFSLA